MLPDEIRKYKRRISEISQTIAENKAELKSAKSNLVEQKEKLKKIGVSTLSELKEKIEEKDEEVITLNKEIEEMLSDAESKI